MDKRLKLTERQKELFNKAESALMELEKSHVKIIWDGVESYHVINAKHVNEIFFPEDIGDGIKEVEISDVPCFSFGSLDLSYCDDSFGVSFT